MNPPTTTKAAGLSNLLTIDEEYAAPRIVDQARDGLGSVDQVVVFHRTGGELHHLSTIEQ